VENNADGDQNGLISMFCVGVMHRGHTISVVRIIGNRRLKLGGVRPVTADIVYKGQVHHATRDNLQYEIRSDKTDHIAMRKGSALRLIRD
jgi:hypothetical protein